LTFDSNGIPKVKYGNAFYYNPVTVSQYALTQYGQYINGNNQAKEKFLKAVDVLISLQENNGGFQYPFAWEYYLTGEIYSPGWFSGMAQGQSLSVLSRAYHLTNDVKYLEVGDKAFEFLIVPVNQGGVMATLSDLDPSLKEYIIFEEYLSEPNNYTLNGFMFTLLGLYDWTNINSPQSDEASLYFSKGLETLVKILPYYDIGGFTAYDLGHLSFDKNPHIGVNYHFIHIYLLHALHSITRNDHLFYYENRWSQYVN
jgi:hypothetical protein